MSHPDRKKRLAALLVMALIGLGGWVHSASGLAARQEKLKLVDKHARSSRSALVSGKVELPVESVLQTVAWVQGVETFVVAENRLGPLKWRMSRIGEVDVPVLLQLSSRALVSEWSAELHGLRPTLPQRFGGVSVQFAETDTSWSFTRPEGRGALVRESARPDRWFVTDLESTSRLPAHVDRMSASILRGWLPVKVAPREGANGFAPLVRVSTSVDR